MPHRKWYVVAAGVFVLGGILAASFAFVRLSGLADTLPQVVVPGSAELPLETAGSYTIFHEAESVVDGRYFSVGDVSGLLVQVVSVETGEPLPLASSGANMTYSLGGRSGRSVLGFEIDRPGTYRVTGSYKSGSGPETVIAVGQGFGKKLVGTILGTLGIGFGFAAAAVAIAVVTFLRRRRAGRDLLATGGAPGAAVPPPLGEHV